jgi:hypothetical protein
MEAFNASWQAVANPGEAPGQLDVALSTVVPVGKQLVVEFVSTRSEMPPGQKPYPAILVIGTGGSALVQHFLVTQFQLNYRGSDIYTSGDPVRMRLPRNLTLRVWLGRDGSDGTAGCGFSISGHLEKA